MRVWAQKTLAVTRHPRRTNARSVAALGTPGASGGAPSATAAGATGMTTQTSRWPARETGSVATTHVAGISTRVRSIRRRSCAPPRSARSTRSLSRSRRASDSPSPRTGLTRGNTPLPSTARVRARVAAHGANHSHPARLGQGAMGIPSVAGETTDPRLVGTMGFMSPAQLRGEPANARSDRCALSAARQRPAATPTIPMKSPTYYTQGKSGFVTNSGRGDHVARSRFAVDKATAIGLPPDRRGIRGRPNYFTKRCNVFRFDLGVVSRVSRGSPAWQA